MDGDDIVNSYNNSPEGSKMNKNDFNQEGDLLSTPLNQKKAVKGKQSSPKRLGKGLKSKKSSKGALKSFTTVRQQLPTAEQKQMLRDLNYDHRKEFKITEIEANSPEDDQRDNTVLRDQQEPVFTEN